MKHGILLILVSIIASSVFSQIPMSTINVGIPSLVSAAKGKNHKYKDFEVDASKKGYKFLIKRMPTLKWDYLNHPLTSKKQQTNVPRKNSLSNPYEYETSNEQQDLEGEIYNW